MKRTKKMPLHRDILWVGKQWSVTGYGMQAIDQKLKGKFDIEVARLWDDDLQEALSDEKWFKPADFEKGLLEARKHYPKPPSRKATAKAKPVLVAPPAPAASIVAKVEPKARPDPAPAKFQMRIIGCRAKFLPFWRVRVR